jgi:4-amino-4-deoxy-L-arabinose transferase-like glycosyltransferase
LPEGGRQREGFVLALLLTVAPIITMSFFKDKNERYLLPMAAPAAVLAAGAAAAWFRSDRRDAAGWVVEIAHWVTLAVIAAGLPLVGLLAPRFGLGERWFSPARAVVVGAAGLAVIGCGLVLAQRVRQRRGGAAAAVVVAATAAVTMLLLQYPVMRGYSRVARSDLRPLADVVWARYPDAVIYEYEPRARTRTYLDLPIYAGRVTRTIRDVKGITPGERPQVVVFLERRGEVPEMDRSWSEIADGGGRKDRWRAYVLPAVP